MILVGGENLIDLVPLKGGADNSFKALPGGSSFNCAMALGRQGQKVGYLTPVSNDSMGDLLANTLTDSGVELLSARRSEPTSLAVVSLKNGTAAYQFYRNNTAERMITLNGLHASTPKSVQALQLGSLAITDGADADIWAEYYCQMHDSGTFTALDPNIRAGFIHDRTRYLARLDTLLTHTDLLKLSDEDLNWLYPNTPLPEAATKLAKRTCAKLLIVTLGPDGAFALANGKTTQIKAAPVPALRDTIGAGDTFMATLLAQLSRQNMLSAPALANMTTQETQALMQWAAQGAALNCTKTGCNPPSHEALLDAAKG